MSFLEDLLEPGTALKYVWIANAALIALMVVLLASAVAYQTMPGLFATGALMTIDGPYMLCWVLALWCMVVAVKQQDARHWPWAYGLVGFFLGLGFLFKYTTLLLLPGLVLYLWLTRSRRAWTWQARLCQALSLLVMLAMSYPVIAWNMQQDWPTLSHLLGRLHLPGGDEAVSHQWSAAWFAEYLLTQVGIIGPAGITVMIMSVVLAMRHRHQDAQSWDGQLTMGDPPEDAMGRPVLKQTAKIVIY